MRTFISLSICLLTTGLSVAQPTVNLVPYATGITNKISDIAHNGNGRLYVTEQLGYIRIIEQGGNVLSRPFLNIFNKVTPTTVSNTYEQGLLGLAFSPTYATDGYFYVNYTNKAGQGNTVIARYHVSSDPDSVDPSTEQILLTYTQPYTNHNGGCMKFGNDGYLYISSGDGGDAGDPGDRAQDLAENLGKILRIDVSGGGAYTIPPTNPFITTMGANPEIWSYGWRNPWRFSFDRLTHDMWIADVGQNVWEEIDFQPAASVGGENYGWRCYEGNAVFNTLLSCASPITQTPPVFVYSHSTTGGCAVTGGFVYRGTAQPALYGYYFFADYCNSTIYAIDPLNGNDTSKAGVFPGRAISTFGEDDNGELFAGDLGNGTVYKIVDANTGLEDLNSGIINVTISPVTNTSFQVNFNLLKSSMVEIKLIDMLGKVVYSQQKTFGRDRHKEIIEPGNLSKGTYLLQLNTAQKTIQKKFIK